MYLERVGLHDGLTAGVDDNLLAVHCLLGNDDVFTGYEQMVRGIDDGALRFVANSSGTGIEGGTLGGGDVAGECLEGLDVALAPDLGILRSEAVDHHLIGSRRCRDGAARWSHELGVEQLSVIRMIEQHFIVLRHLDGLLHLHVDIHIDVDVQLYLQVERQRQDDLLQLQIVERHALARQAGQQHQGEYVEPLPHLLFVLVLVSLMGNTSVTLAFAGPK